MQFLCYYFNLLKYSKQFFRILIPVAFVFSNWIGEVLFLFLLDYLFIFVLDNTIKGNNKYA